MHQFDRQPIHRFIYLSIHLFSPQFTYQFCMASNNPFFNDPTSTRPNIHTPHHTCIHFIYNSFIRSYNQVLISIRSFICRLMNPSFTHPSIHTNYYTANPLSIYFSNHPSIYLSIHSVIHLLTHFIHPPTHLTHPQALKRPIK